MFALTRSLLRGAELQSRFLRALPSMGLRSFADAAEEKIVSYCDCTRWVEPSAHAGNDD